jgi:hypothetical protein
MFLKTKGCKIGMNTATTSKVFQRPVNGVGIKTTVVTT